MSLRDVQQYVAGVYEPTDEEVKKYLQYRVIALIVAGVDLVGKNTERTDGIVPGKFPDVQGWRTLMFSPLENWAALGMVQWDKSLWLFPKEWHSEIPEGFPCYAVSEKKMYFSKNSSFHYIEGVLGYGVLHPKGIMSEETMDWFKAMYKDGQPTTH